MWIDLLRSYARLKRMGRKNITPKLDKLHCGCGTRRVKGWLNVDLIGSEYDVDLASRLPWKKESFRVIVSQHVIEHLELVHELMPLLAEFERVLLPGGELWISTPDLEKVCKSYVNNRMKDFIDYRRRIWGSYSMEGIPDQHFVNVMFHQHGYHKNLFDFGLLRWMLEKVGFTCVKRVSEPELIQRYPEFPLRGDDFESVYVFATKKR